MASCKICGSIHSRTPKATCSDKCNDVMIKNRNDKKLKNKYSKMYGIPVEQIEQFKEQPCGICGDKSSVTDHCHKTDVVRGRLCSNCNRALGLFGDDQNTLQNAITYLTNSKTEYIVNRLFWKQTYPKTYGE